MTLCVGWRILMVIWLFLSITSLSITAAVAEQESPSFYGKRSVVPEEIENQAPQTHFQRRSIIAADPTLEQVDSEKSPTMNDSSALLGTNTAATVLSEVERPTLIVPIELTRNEKLLAKKAHYYFERNWNKTTGLTDSVQGYRHVTMWDIASDISAQLSLEYLSLQSTEVTDKKLVTMLETLATMPLYNNKLPNREYSTVTGTPTGKYSKTTSNGNGWSALDIGRLLIWLHILKQEKESLRIYIDTIIKKWSLSSAIHNHTLYGTKLTKRGEHYRQEGRLGYLQYAASGFALFGFDVHESYQDTSVTSVNIDGVSFLVDTRNMPFSTADPYLLTRIELGQFGMWWEQLDSIYLLYKNQKSKTNDLWVFAEDAMNRTPWFAYNNIYFYGKSWLSTSSGGKPVEVFQIFSNKVAFGLGMIYDDDYAKEITQQVIDNSLYSRSVPTGLYQDGSVNSAYNINTNSMILSALVYKLRRNTPVLLPSNIEQLKDTITPTKEGVSE